MLEKSLKIGVSKSLLSTNVAEGIISENEGFQSVKIRGKGSLDTIKHELYDKEYDFACVPLSKLPFTLPDGIVLAGVSKRYDQTLRFIGNKKSINGETLRDLKPAAKILVQSQIIKEQLMELLPETECIVSNAKFGSFSEQLSDEKIDGFICPIYELDLNDFDDKDYYQWDFSPYEMVGTPAAGVSTFICRMDDIVVRKFIKDMHKNEISMCTNIERKIMRSFDSGKIAAFSFRDERGNFQIHAASKGSSYERCFFTQSTSAGLAEKIIELLTNEANLSHI